MMEIIPCDISSTIYLGHQSCYSSESNIPNEIGIVFEQDQTIIEKPATIDEQVVFAFKTLLKKYKRQMGDAKDLSIVTGGLQQYLNKKALKKTEQTDYSIQSESIFHTLPIECKLHIFSFLGPQDLCRISAVCRDWYFVSEDNILWKELIERDVKVWNVIGHSTNPALYQEVQSDWTNKEIYLRCSPDINKMMHKNDAVFSFTDFLKSFLPKKSWTPKIAMFGPGLESDLTSGIVRKILYENNQYMERTGLVSGQFEGVGSGWCYRLPNGQTFQLSVLYSASKEQRTKKSWNRVTGNNLIKVQQGEEGEETVELKPAVRDFCRTVDAFIYVVDSTSKDNLRANENYELSAMIRERWSETHIPVLVMSCIPDKLSTRIPCVDVVEALHLGKLNRPWQVRDCWIENLDGVVDGLSWLIEQAHRR